LKLDFTTQEAQDLQLDPTHPFIHALLAIIALEIQELHVLLVHINLT